MVVFRQAKVMGHCSCNVNWSTRNDRYKVCVARAKCLRVEAKTKRTKEALSACINCDPAGYVHA